MKVDDLIPHLERFQSYDEAVSNFRPQLPEALNIADVICRSHKDRVSRVALIEAKPSDENIYTFGALDYFSDKFANVLKGCGVSPGDTVAVMLPQSAALVVAHLGILKLGGIVLPIATDTGEAIVEQALKEIAPRAAVLPTNAIDRSANCVVDTLSPDSIFIATDFRSREEFGYGYRGFWREVYLASPDFASISTAASTPAFIFPPVSTEDARSVVHAHRLLIGQLPAFEMSNNFDFGDDTVFYTLSEWSTVEALFGMLYPALLYGRPMVAQDKVMRPTNELFERLKITNLFISEDKLKQLSVDLQADTTLRNIVAVNMLDQNAERLFGIDVSRVYAKRETGVLAATCKGWFDSSSDSHGRAVPGSLVEVTDSADSVLPAGMSGHIAVYKEAASLFLSYFNDPEKTSSAFVGDWFLTGDAARKDENGDLWIRR